MENLSTTDNQGETTPPGFIQRYALPFLAGYIIGLVVSAMLLFFLLLKIFSFPAYMGVMFIDDFGTLFVPPAQMRRPVHSLAFSRPRFAQVSHGMNTEQVVNLLGEPLLKKVYNEDEDIMVWAYSSFPIHTHNVFRYDVLFKNGKVVRTEKKEYLD